ncbi:hypothetical protein PFAG_05935, partial [Plasmodium falciparum Santa Lucia]
WVHDMLIDSIKWRDEHGKCINKDNDNTCIRGCKSKCDCFQKWVAQKKNEWGKIKDHFYKQKDIGQKGGLFSLSHDAVLQTLLKKDLLLQIIQDAYGNANEIKHIEELLKDEEKGITGVLEGKTIIDYLLDHEEEDAKKCVSNNPDKDCKKAEESVARSDTVPQSPHAGGGAHDNDGDQQEEEESESEDDNEDEVEEEEEVCGMVDTLIKKNNGKQPIENCNPKEYNNQAYPEWECVKNSKLVSGDGECMPPRRQKLCLYFVADPKETEKIKKQDDLTDAFIKTAAAETFHAWHYYKKKNSSSGNLDEKLKQGEIPSEFLRSMFFTYGDYRDIFFDTDISEKTEEGHVKKAIDCIGKFFSNDGSKSPGNLSRDEWWKKYGEDIWKGMICALTHGVTNTDNKRKIKTTYSYYNVNKPTTNGTTPLEDFAKKPQFLRWMIEWGEEFCREREKLEDNVKTECNRTNSSDVCKPGSSCKSACEKYEDYVKKKKEQFKGQTTKFVQNVYAKNADPEYNDYKLKKGSSPIQGNEYLLEKCDNKKCDCMKGNVGSFLTDEKPFGIYAHKYPEKCNCLGAKFVPTNVPPAQQPPPPPVIPAPTVDVCATVAEALTKGDLNAACTQKYGHPQRHWGWKCVTPTTSNDTTREAGKGGGGGGGSSEHGSRHRRSISAAPGQAPNGKDSAGSICVPPRRRRLYVTPLTKLTGDNTAASQVDGTTGQSQNGEAASNGPTDPVESLQAQVDEAKGGVQGTEGRVKPNGQTAEGSQSHPVSSAKALEPVGISSQTSEGKTTSKSSGKDPREALRDAFIQSAAVGTFFLWHNYKEQFKAQHGAVEALGGFGTYGVRADGPGLVPFSGPQPTLPQAPFAASQGKVGPAGLGPGAGLPRGQHGQPHGTQLGAP